MRTRAWSAFLACGTSGALLHPLTSGALPRALTLLAAAAAVAAVVTGVRLHGVRRPLPWLLMALGLFGFLIADAVWIYYDFVLHVEPFPSPADVLYLASYGAMLVALAVLVRRQRSGGGGDVLDACIVTVGVGVIAWVFVLVPAATGPDLSVAGRVISVAYPMADLMLLSCSVRLAFAVGGRSRSLQLLTAGLSALLTADALYAVENLGGALTSPVSKPLWLFSYVLIGAAALHPSTASVDEPPAAALATMTRGRLALLASASLIAPATLAVQEAGGGRVDGWAIAGASAVLFLLVVARMWGLVHQVQAQAARLATLATTDALTGAANRRAWDEHLPAALATAERTGEGVCVALLDLDLFKAYNDSRGHAAGDDLLRTAVAAWRRQLRDTDVLARYGGEEFGLLLPGMGPESVEALLDRLRRTVPDGQTCSIGWACWDGSESVTALVERADIALYAAKRAGRDRILLAAP